LTATQSIQAISVGTLSESWAVWKSLTGRQRDLIVPRAKEAEVLLTTRTPLSGQTLMQLKRLRYIGEMFTGYDEIDLKTAQRAEYSRHEHPDVWNRLGGSAGLRALAGTLSSRRAS
jgi:phosphoglycerate dehydrogenase-like enzyme